MSLKELKEFYEDDKDEFIRGLLDNISGEIFFDKLITNDREFLKEYSPQIHDLIEHRLINSEGLSGEYYEWDKRKFEAKDFTIDDILNFVKILQYPPLPIRRIFPNDEDIRDKEHILTKLTNESSYKFLKAGELFCDLIISGNLKGDFRLWTESGLEYYVHITVISEYEVFSKHIAYKENEARTDTKNNMRIDTNNDKVLIALIKFLYGQRIELEVEDAVELAAIADCLDLVSLVQICTVIADDTDFEAEYQYKELTRNINNFFY